jgi:predicted YcjX-like family ATPase
MMDSMLKNSPRTFDASAATEKQLALQFLLDAWEEAAYEGVDRDCIATAAIFAALSELISTYGEEPVAVMCERLPERVRTGEFSLIRSRQ